MVGVEGPGNHNLTKSMLDKIIHRGKEGYKIYENNWGSVGIISSKLSKTNFDKNILNNDVSGLVASSTLTQGDFKLKRDRLGVNPLYYGRTTSGNFCFAPEVKALLAATNDINEFPPGYFYKNGKLEQYYQLKKLSVLKLPEEQIAKELREILINAVRNCINSERIGSWLSGGLDSSAIVAIARPYVNKLYTFSIGLPGAPDLEFADEVAKHIKSDHHRYKTNINSMINALPKVIYHMESFDALLIRSSITNYLIAQAASDYVDEVFSGEGGDELFAGYDYLKSIDAANLSNELIDIIGRLHNTAFQRVDRSASAFGMIAHIPFANSDLVEYAIRIPAELKINCGIEKWILREAMNGILPEKIRLRPKVKFWEGAGVKSLLADYADRIITNSDFNFERNLKNGLKLNSKEELMYYRIFRQHFGELENFSWMGRTKITRIN